jgi:hypothetical protein
MIPMQASTRRPPALRRRNRLTAIAVCLIAATFVFSRNQLGVQWFAWRDAPIPAAAVVGVALLLAALAWRSGRR